MSEQELAEIRETLAQAQDSVRHGGVGLFGPRTVERLLAEVERLRAENAALREIAQAVAAMDIVSAEARTLVGIPSGRTHADLIAKARALLADATPDALSGR